MPLRCSLAARLISPTGSHAPRQAAQRVDADDPPAAQADFPPRRRSLRAHPGVEAFCRRDLLARRQRSHGHVPDRPVAVLHGGRVRANPIEVAVLPTILDQGAPRRAGLDRRPEVAEGLFRHVGVPDDVMRLAQQFVAGKTADADERGVAVDDPALQVGDGDKRLLRRNQVLRVGNRKVLAHEYPGLSPGLSSMRSWRKPTPAIAEEGGIWRAISRRRRRRPLARIHEPPARPAAAGNAS